MHVSFYNVYDEHGQVIIAPGDPIDEAEAIRQGIIRPEPTPEPAQPLAEAVNASADAVDELKRPFRRQPAADEG